MIKKKIELTVKLTEKEAREIRKELQSLIPHEGKNWSDSETLSTLDDKISQAGIDR